jgi:hypothetical protein
MLLSFHAEMKALMSNQEHMSRRQASIETKQLNYTARSGRVV